MALLPVDKITSICSPGYRHRLISQESDGSAGNSSFINYDKLKQLCLLHNSCQDTTDRDVHSLMHTDFMSLYPKIFIEPTRKTRKVDELIIKRLSKVRRSKIYNPVNSVETADLHNSPSHDISNYLPQLHPIWSKNKPIDESELFNTRISTLRRLLKKLPVERTREENIEIYEAVKHFSSLTDQVTPQVLKELCTVAVLDVWRDQNITVYGSFGFYVVLTGSVQSLGTEERKPSAISELRNPTPEFNEHGSYLTVGDSFGSLSKITGRSLNTRHLSVRTIEPRCEFLLITSSDFERISNKIKTKTRDRNVTALHSCKTYAHWSVQALVAIADILCWTRLQPNTVIVTEGACASYVGIVKSGDVDIMRNIDVVNLLPNRRKKKSLKNVTIGKISPFESFGEYSILRQQPMDCTLKTVTAVELAVIDAAALQGLDEDTRQLILQSCQKTFVNKTLQEIHNEYIKQELDDRWTTYKQCVVTDVLNQDQVGVTPDYADGS